MSDELLLRVPLQQDPARGLSSRVPILHNEGMYDDVDQKKEIEQDV